MPSIRDMNTPNHPFWDFVQEMNGHPAWAGPPPPPPQHSHDEAGAPTTGPEAGPSTNEKGASAEDPPEVDPTTVRPPPPPEAHGLPFRGRGRCGGRGGRFGDRHDREERREERRGPCGRRSPEGRHGPGGRHGHGEGPPRGEWPPFGQPPFGFGGPFWARSAAHRGPPRPGYYEGPEDHSQPRGSPERHGRCGGRGPHAEHHPSRHGPRGRRGQWGSGFNLGQFLSEQLGRVGQGLSGAGEGMGLERFMDNGNNADFDFEPKTDIFEQKDKYTIHISLPGAKKEDVGVDWDGENSILKVAGVVHRPGVDEEMLEQLVVDGRKKEVGVFEKAIRLGTRHEPASVDVAGIKAKMVDGVLIVRVPKVEVEHQKRDVPISNNTTPSPQRGPNNTVFDADHEIEMHDAEAEEEVVEMPHQAPVRTEKGKTKEAEYQQEKQQQHASSSAVNEEPLPVYQATTPTVVADNEVSDWENYGSEEEGEYVKINVD